MAPGPLEPVAPALAILSRSLGSLNVYPENANGNQSRQKGRPFVGLGGNEGIIRHVGEWFRRFTRSIKLHASGSSGFLNSLAWQVSLWVLVDRSHYVFACKVVTQLG